MNCLLLAIGTAGDVHPVVGLGLALQARGHRVAVITTPQFEPLVRLERLELVSWAGPTDLDTILNDPDAWNPRRSLELLVRQLMIPTMRPLHAVVAKWCCDPGTVVVAPLWALGARLAHEELGVPLLTLALQPASFRSTHLPAVVPGLWLPTLLPRPLKKFIFWLMDTALWHRYLAADLNSFRLELGLPVHRLDLSWLYAPQLVLGLFPDWFGPPQPDWPPQTRLTSFPLYDAANVADVPPQVEEFLAKGAPPVLITASSSMQHASVFFEAAVGACRALGRRALVLTRFRQQLPLTLPEGVQHFSYVPFSRILPRSAALIHHGGVGTIALGLAAGTPQLVVPVSHDQPDNAARLDRLGAALVCPYQRFQGAVATRALARLLGDRALAARCRAFAERLHQVDPLTEACRSIEELLMSVEGRVGMSTV